MHTHVFWPDASVIGDYSILGPTDLAAIPSRAGANSLLVRVRLTSNGAAGVAEMLDINGGMSPVPHVALRLPSSASAVGAAKALLVALVQAWLA